jgi:hypothetical protein
MKLRLFSLAAAAALVAAAVSSAGAPASAASTVVVTASNQQGWTGVPPGADTRPGGAFDFVTDASAPGGDGALQLTTDATPTAKAQYMHTANVPLSQVNDLSYWTKQVSASFSGGDPSYQLPVCLGGFTTPTALNPTGCVGFTTLVFEPYQNNGLAPPSAPVLPNTWQYWDVDAGQFWSSRSYTNGACSVTAGFGGTYFYTLSGLSSVCPNAVAVGFGVNIGSNNPSYDVYTDLLTFNGTTYDFEVYSAPSDKDQCKNGGWATFNPNRPAGAFKNQGDCIQYANTGK